MEAMTPYSYAGLPIAKRRAISIEDIENIISEYFDIPIQQIISKKRDHHIVFARQFAIYFTRKYTNLSLKTIGLHFMRDHSTVIYSCRLIKDCKDYDPAIKEAYPILDEMIQKIKIMPC